MTDERDDLAELENSPDVQLILEFLSGDLQKEGIAEVRRRLEEDPVFRDMAAPILYLWKTPPYWLQAPTPPGALEKSWDQYTKKAGFAHQRRKSRLRWYRIGFFSVIAAIALSIAGYVSRQAIEERWTISHLMPVTDTATQVRLCDGSTVTRTKGTQLRIAKCIGRGDELRLVYLSEGNARFRINLQETFSAGRPLGSTRVLTPAGNISAHKADFQVSLSGDTATVYVYRTGEDVPPGGMLPGVEIANPRNPAARVSLNPGQACRIVRGGDPIVIP